MSDTGRPSRPPHDERQDDALLSKATEENVDAMLVTVRGLLDAEESRDQSFNARGVGLAGFVGIVVSLSTTLGRDALSTDLQDPWQAAALALFGLALLFLIMTVVVVVLGVLRPRESAHLGIEEVEHYPSTEYVLRPKVLNQGSVLRGLIEVLAIERKYATRKASALRRGYWLLIGGLLSIAVLGFIMGLADANLIGNGDEERRQTCTGRFAESAPGRGLTTGSVAFRATCHRVR